MIKISLLLLSKTAIPFDKEEFSFQIKSHPSYPSLHSITGVLNHFNIENIAAKVPVNKETLNKLPSYFLAQINEDKGLDLVFVEKLNGKYQIYNSEKKKRMISEEIFLTIFTGIVLAVEKDENAKEKKSNKSFTNIVTFSLVAISILTLFFLSTSEIIFHYSLLLSIIGILISISIVKQEFGIKNTIGDAFCSSNDNKKDCNAVLTSKGATIIKGHKLSDLSLIYFVGLSLSILFLSMQQLSLNITSLIALTSLPFTIYSIYYQAFTVKKWCLLCLSIVGLLWVYTALPFLFSEFSTNFKLIELLTTSTCFLFAFNTWSSLKPTYIEIIENRKTKIDYFKFKKNYTLFKSLLSKSPQINTALFDSKEIIFGNLNSSLEITLITNPFCGHCKPVHTHINKILQRHHNNVKIRIRFNVDAKDENNDLTKITSRLLEIYNTKGEKECLLAMNDIYNEKKPNDWFKKWGNCFEKERYILELEKEKSWCQDNAINFTPEILINGKSFPKEYDRPDLIFFIEELHEESNVNLKVQETVY